MLWKTKHRAAIYSTGEIWGFESACSVSNHIIAERWRHARTKVTPQVLKSSIAAPPSRLSFISSSLLLACIHLPRLFICAVSLLITYFFDLPSNDLWDRFYPQTIFPPVDLSVSPYSWLSAEYFTPSLSIYLLFLCSSGCLLSHRLSVLSSCHLPTCFSSFLTLLVFSSPFTILSLFSLIVSPLSDRFCFRPLHLAVAHPLHLMQLYQIWSPLCRFTFYISIQRWQKLDFLT